MDRFSGSCVREKIQRREINIIERLSWKYYRINNFFFNIGIKKQNIYIDPEKFEVRKRDLILGGI